MATGTNPPPTPDDVPPPPSAFAAVFALGGGALGAVAIAAIGVYGVFKMAFWVASETGRSINAQDPAAAAGVAAPQASSSSQQQAAPSSVKAASPLEPRKEVLLTQLPRWLEQQQQQKVGAAQPGQTTR
ncbi:hypothetical protein N2152v2_002508 [Parachlorella kessleri]